MTYRPEPGDIGLTTISGHVGRMVRVGQWMLGDGFGKVQHAFVVTGYRQGLPKTPWIVEAMPGGARHVKNWHTDVHYLRCPEKYREAVATCAVGYTGVPYSMADYFSLAAHRLHIPAPHLRSYIRTSKHQICSQLADAAADNGGWHLFDDGRWPGDITPMDLENLYQKMDYS